MTISKDHPYINIKAVTVKVWCNKQSKVIHITGRTVARSIVALVVQGANGITALEMSSWAFRLGAYIFILKNKYGLNIETKREEHPHGWHGRYVLHTPVEIVEIEYDK